MRITISENGLNGHAGHAGHADDIIPAADVTCPAGVAVHVTSPTQVHHDDRIHVDINTDRELTSSSVVPVVISQQDDADVMELIDLRGSVPVSVVVNGGVIPADQVRLLLLRPVGGTIDLATAVPVINVRLDDADVSDASSVTFGSTPIAISPAPSQPTGGTPTTNAPAPPIGGANPAIVPVPAATGNAGLGMTGGQMPWAPAPIVLALALVTGGRLLGTHGRRR